MNFAADFVDIFFCYKSSEFRLQAVSAPRFAGEEPPQGETLNFTFDMENKSKKIIALLTDFGTKDYFVGAMKGVILSINSQVNIVDITHEVEPQNIASAEFTLRACYANFPKQTIFIAVVDPGVGSNRKAIVVETGDYYFIAPDNGLLSFVFSTGKNCQVYELTNEKFFAENVSATFHGRDIFAPVAAHLSNGVQSDEFGRQITDYIRFDESKPRIESDGKITGEIIHIDRFGNLITNLTKEYLPDEFVAEVNNVKIKKIRNFFAEAEKSELFVIFGSAGFLEIVAFQDSAAGKLKAEIGDKIIVELT